MLARISKSGILEFNRNGIWREQVCVQKQRMDFAKCCDSCPLMDYPKKVKTEEDISYILACCEFEVGSETEFYQKE